MSDQIIDIIDVAIPGDTGDVTPAAIAARDAAIAARNEAVFAAEHSGNLASATAETVPADQPASVTLSGPLNARNAHFKNPRGLPGVNAVENDEAVATYIAATDSEVRAALDRAYLRGEPDSEGSRTFTVESPADKWADTSRIHITSHQKQEVTNNWDGGETVWLDLSDPRAKSMLTWRIQYNPSTRMPYPWDDIPVDAPMRRIVWAGAHYWAQDQADDNDPDDVHGHWSVEVPDTAGSLQTRFGIDFINKSSGQIGVETTEIYTNRANFSVVARGGVGENGVFKIVGPNDTALNSNDGAIKIIRFQNTAGIGSRRWDLLVGRQHESGSNDGSHFTLRAFDDSGAWLADYFSIHRGRGEISLGGGISSAPRSARLHVPVRQGFSGQSGVLIESASALSGGSAITTHLSSLSDRVIQSKIGSEASYRFVVTSSGTLEWGDGTSSTRDVNLYRDSANVLATTDDFLIHGIGRGLRLTDGSGNHWRVTIDSLGNLATTKL